MSNVFEFNDYRSFLKMMVGDPRSRTGIRSAMADSMGCQLTYLSQVLGAKADLSLEQAEKLSQFFSLTKDEKRFFLTLVQKDRAGTTELKKYFENLLSEIREDRLIVKKRLGSSGVVADKFSPIYYSSWQFAAIHMALTVPRLRTKEALAKYYQIPTKNVAQILDFLVLSGLAVTNGSEFSAGPKHVRIGKETPLIYKHHAHWRNKAIEHLELEENDDLHYSAVVTLSKADAVAIKDKILQELQNHLAVIKTSKEEEVVCYNIDFFKLKRCIA